MPIYNFRYYVHIIRRRNESCSRQNEDTEQRDKKAYFEGGRDEGNKVYREV